MAPAKLQRLILLSCKVLEIIRFFKISIFLVMVPEKSCQIKRDAYPSLGNIFISKILIFLKLHLGSSEKSVNVFAVHDVFLGAVLPGDIRHQQ